VGVLLIGFVGRFAYTFVLGDLLCQEAKSDNVEAMARVLKYGGKVDAPGMFGMTPLMTAAEAGNYNSIVFLLGSGADVNAHGGNGSVLMCAARSGNVNVVRTLIRSGADVNWHSDAGESALKTAKDDNQQAVANALRSAGAQD
jgi:ankyrin repeat protein